MMQSTLQRRRAAFDFSQCYEDYCCSHGACPLALVTARPRETWLQCSGERIRATDWIPLCEALQINRSLEGVEIAFDPAREQLGKSRRGQSAPAGVKPGTAGYLVAASRMDRSAIVRLLCKTLGGLLHTSKTLTVLCLEGVSIRFDDVELLAKGFSSTSRVQSLSMAHCRIGDSGAEVLCSALERSRCVQHLNLSSCGMTRKAVSHLNKLIEKHASWRYAHLWQVSLRQVQASTDSVGGLRRLTLCSNPMIGDQGVHELVDTLKDDIWIKAVDMQHCGLSNCGVRRWLNLLRSGSMSLLIVDLRQNPLADKPLIRAVMEQIVVNGHSINDDPEYQWLSKVVSTTPDGFHGNSSRGAGNTPGCRRPLSTQPVKAGKCQQRSRSVDARRPVCSRRPPTTCPAQRRKSVRRGRTGEQHAWRSDEELVVIEPVRGMPWRTAARSALRKRAAHSTSAPINLHTSPDAEEALSADSVDSSSNPSDEETISDVFDGATRKREPAATPAASRAEPCREATPFAAAARPPLPPRAGSSTQSLCSYEYADESRRPHARAADSYGYGGAELTGTDTCRPRRSSPGAYDRPSTLDGEVMPGGNPTTCRTPVPVTSSGGSSSSSSSGTGAGTSKRHRPVTGYSFDPGLYHRHEAVGPPRRMSSRRAPHRHRGHDEHDGRRLEEDADVPCNAEGRSSFSSNPSLTGIRDQTSIDEELLLRFETALQKFSSYLRTVKGQGQ